MLNLHDMKEVHGMPNNIGGNYPVHIPNKESLVAIALMHTSFFSTASDTTYTRCSNVK